MLRLLTYSSLLALVATENEYKYIKPDTLIGEPSSRLGHIQVSRVSVPKSFLGTQQQATQQGILNPNAAHIPKFFVPQKPTFSNFTTVTNKQDTNSSYSTRMQGSYSVSPSSYNVGASSSQLISNQFQKSLNGYEKGLPVLINQNNNPSPQYPSKNTGRFGSYYVYKDQLAAYRAQPIQKQFVGPIPRYPPQTVQSASQYRGFGSQYETQPYPYWKPPVRPEPQRVGQELQSPGHESQPNLQHVVAQPDLYHVLPPTQPIRPGPQSRTLQVPRPEPVFPGQLPVSSGQLPVSSNSLPVSVGPLPISPVPLPVITGPLPRPDQQNYYFNKQKNVKATSSSTSRIGSKQNGDHFPIPGEPDKDYPILTGIPETSFRCEQQPYPGHYADVETRCQVFHICVNNKMYDFLCPNGTIFSQQLFACVWWNQFDCNTATSLYELNGYICKKYNSDYQENDNSEADSDLPPLKQEDEGTYEEVTLDNNDISEKNKTDIETADNDENFSEDTNDSQSSETETPTTKAHQAKFGSRHQSLRGKQKDSKKKIFKKKSKHLH